MTQEHKSRKVYRILNPERLGIPNGEQVLLFEKEHCYESVADYKLSLPKDLVEGNAYIYKLISTVVGVRDDYYDLSKSIKDVKEFRDKFNLSVNLKKYDKALHRRLIVEEFDEFLEAFDEDDFANQLKEAADIHYVIQGSFLDVGIAHYYQKMWEAVVENNLAKLGPDGKPMYREDGKLIKPEGFVKVNPDEAAGFSDRRIKILNELKLK